MNTLTMINSVSKIMKMMFEHFIDYQKKNTEDASNFGRHHWPTSANLLPLGDQVASHSLDIEECETLTIVLTFPHSTVISK